MNIICNKAEYAELIANCKDSNTCFSCALNGACAGLGEGPKYARLVEICEIKETQIAQDENDVTQTGL